MYILFIYLYIVICNKNRGESSQISRSYLGDCDENKICGISCRKQRYNARVKMHACFISKTESELVQVDLLVLNLSSSTMP